MSWQLVIVLEVEGTRFPLTPDETREVIRTLREPNPYAPDTELGAVAAAVFLERLLEDPTTQNPPMTDEEAGGILIALGRMMVTEGLSGRQADLHDALLAYLGRGGSNP